ncbi:TPA: N-6 DNA methylase [Legionella pneumophila]
MNYSMHNTITNFIWGIADDVLRDVYVRGKYRDVILPMTVIRRLDALLEPTKEAVLSMKKQLDEAGIANQDAALCQSSGEAFYNCSPFTLRDLKNRAKIQQLKADFESYLDGFSPNVQEILDKFKFRNQIATLIDADILGALLEKFLNPNINLSPKAVCDAEGNERLPSLDNHAMGTVFEELIRRFNEENNEEAGEHFTPRDIVKLMADVIFLPIADEIESGTYLVYDGACGTGGMLTVVEERLQELAKDAGKEVSIHLYGQEVQPETYAIAKADLLLKGEGAEAENIKYGSTLSADAFVSNQFDFMISNPPYGKSWKTDLDRMGGKSDIKDPRFIIDYANDPEYKMITRSSDGQLMFLVNKLMKMKDSSKLGSRIAHVHNGSSLFTGDAGQGESNIRRWIIENDWLEAIIALPENIFYNTGIATYIWVLTNQKFKERKGKVQLIDATGWYQSLRKNLGKKNCELTDEHIKQICDLIINQIDTEQSKLFPNEAFGYYKISVERPLRLSIHLGEKQLTKFKQQCGDAKEEALFSVIEVLSKQMGEGPHKNYNQLFNEFNNLVKSMSIKLSAKSIKFLRDNLAIVDNEAEPVIKKIYKTGTTSVNPVHGLFETTVNGKSVIIEYESDSNLRDSEQVPLLESGGITAFFEREVLPYTLDAWIDSSKTLIGYEISFIKHFYKPAPMRTLEDIKTDIFAIERETEGLLEEIVGEAGK